MDTKITSALTKQDDGDIIITYTIPTELITKTKSEVLVEIAKNTEIPGFRKGMAPINKVEENVNKEKVLELILNKILPQAFSDSIETHKLKPAMYPKFEAIKIDFGSDFEIRATTCELPEITLGDYKNKISGELRASKIVVPGKNPPSQNSNETKEQKLIEILLNSIKINIPQILIEEEVNGRLSSLLARIEKLGLQLEGYLKTVGKTPDSLREEYKKQSEDAIKLELILNKIADEEKIEVTTKEVEDFIKSTGADTTKIEEAQKESLIRIIKRKKALEKIAIL